MIDYSDWELRKLSVDSIRLDKQNPRLPEDMLNESQAEIINYLINEFKILEIAQSIAKNGFFINEVPIVVKDGRHFVVVEGNRRITALKLLRNPELAPPRKKHTYSRLAEDIDTAQWEKLNMYIAPSKEDAAPVLIARHGSEMTSPWQRIMKMRFLAGDVLKGIPHEQIATRYSVPISEVKTAAVTMLIREMIRSADIDDETKDAYLSEKFQTSTITRIIETKRFTDLTGLKLNGAKLQYEIPKEEFLKLILRICHDIHTGITTHRTHEDAKARYAYIESLFAEIASGKKEKNEFEAQPKEMDGEKEEPRKPKSRKKWERLIPETMSYTTGMPKLNELIGEGQKMSVTSYPHAGGLLLRTILDLAVQRLYDIHGELNATKSNNGRTCGLTQRIKNIHNKHSDWFSDRATCEKFKRFTAGDSESFIHIETLNDYVHGGYGKPTKDDLSNFWSQIEPLLDLILEEEN